MDAYFTLMPFAASVLYIAALQQLHPLAHVLRQLVPVSFFWKETGTLTTAAAHAVRAFAAVHLVTIGVTNTDVTCHSVAGDGAAAHGMDCT